MVRPVNLIMPHMKGGIERVDIETGQVVIRHPTKGTLTIKIYSSEQAARIYGWHTAMKADPRSAPLIQNALPDLSDDQREELMTGIPGDEFDKLFREEDEPADPDNPKET